VIAVEALAVELGGRRVADGVTLSVPRGGWTTLIGPNGAGKSTVLRAVAGLVAHGGAVAVDGVPVRDASARRRARLIASVPQAPLLPPDMTVGEYAMLGRTAHLTFLGRPGEADRAAAAAALERLDLAALAGRRLDELSGGERQRVVLARAIAQDAPVLLLDEPTAALDVGRQQEVLELVDALRAERDLTVLGAMHDLTLAGQYAERLALLDRGRLVAHGPPRDVLTEPLIESHYRARVRVTQIAASPVVVPSR
jgi:iron complex transport system ATP-binding protein